MKFILWLGKLTIATCFITTITLYATWMAVQTYVDKLLAHYQLADSMNKIQFSDFLAGLGGSVNILEQPASRKEAVPRPDTGIKAPTSISGEEQPADSRPNPYEEPKGDDAVAVWSQNRSGSEQQKKVIVTTEEFQKTKDTISNEDKMKLFSMLVSRLPQEELQTLSTLVEDGITEKELEEINGIVEKHLKPEEYKELIAILEKY